MPWLYSNPRITGSPLEGQSQNPNYKLTRCLSSILKESIDLYEEMGLPGNRKEWRMQWMTRRTRFSWLKTWSTWTLVCPEARQECFLILKRLQNALLLHEWLVPLDTVALHGASVWHVVSNLPLKSDNHNDPANLCQIWITIRTCIALSGIKTSTFRIQKDSSDLYCVGSSIMPGSNELGHSIPNFTASSISSVRNKEASLLTWQV